jgi:MFS family permease
LSAATAAGLALPILALCLGHVFSNAVRTLPAVAVDVLTRDLGITAEELAAITGAFPAAFAAAMIPVGVALDRYGVRRTSLALLAVAGSGALLGAAATGPWSMLAAQVVLGAGCSGMMMCPMTFAARGLAPARFAVWSGIIQAVGNTGMLLTASPLALLVEAAGWRAGFLASAALAVVAAAGVAALVREAPPAGARRQSLLADVREVLALAVSPAMRPLMAIAFASFGAVLGVRGLWGGPWLMEVKGLSRVEAGNVLLACTLALTVGPALAGLVVRRFGRASLLLAGSHLAAAALVLGLVAGGAAAPVAWDTALLVLFGVIISFQVLTFPLVRAVVAPEQTGRALSAQNMSFFGGAAVLQLLSGVAAGVGGVGAALATFAVALVLCTGLFLGLRR